MYISILFSCLLIFITSNLQADANPIPNDPKAEKKMAQELRTQIQEEISQTQSLQAQRSTVSEILSDIAMAPMAQALPVRKQTSKPNEEMKKRTIKIQQSEKDRYEKPTL